MAEFSSLDSTQSNIPLNPGTNDYGLGDLTNPDNVLSGQLRGSQYVGSPSLQIDSTNNLINIKGAGVLSNSVVKYGEIDANHLGLAVNDGTNDILFAGQDSTTTPASIYVKIAKTGFDAKTAVDSNLVFNSNQDILKVVKSGTINASATYSGSNINNTISITHGLGFIPITLVYYLFSGSTYLQLPIINGIWTGMAGSGVFNITSRFDYSINSNTLNIEYGEGNTTGGPVNYIFKYFLLQESIT